MIRRLLRALDRDHAVAAIAIVCGVVGYVDPRPELTDEQWSDV